MEIEGLPGAQLIEQGLADLARGEESVPSLLASIGSARQRLLGLDDPSPLPDAERRLYRLLERKASTRPTAATTPSSGRSSASSAPQP